MTDISTTRQILDKCPRLYFSKYEDTQDLWYCVQLLDRRKRNKQSIIPQTISAWADLDDCDPAYLLVEPTLLIESSPNRFQALWSLADPIPSVEASELSKRIAYAHEAHGADTSGWDMGQLLRVPYTQNMKYDPAPPVQIVGGSTSQYDVSAFDVYPQLEDAVLVVKERPMPKRKETGEQVLNRYDHLLARWDWDMFFQEPESDWSAELWKFENRLLELGLSAEEVFCVCWDAACNKYARDKDKRPHPEVDLWNEILRVEAKHALGEIPVFDIPQPRSNILGVELLSEEDRNVLRSERTVIEDYIDWGMLETDASPDFHLGAVLLILSHLLCERVVIPIKSQELKLNLWVMLLADTTMNRKSTTMGLAMDLLQELDEFAVIANDATWEGLFKSLGERGPNRASVFERDDFQGLLQQISRREYYSGLPAFMTKMYDGKTQSRKLSQGKVLVKDPLLLLFVAGGRTPILEGLTLDQITDGFLPRFLFVSSEYDPKRIRDFEFGLGVGQQLDDVRAPRRLVYAKLYKLYRFYQDAKESDVMIKGKKIMKPKTFYCRVGDGVVELYNRFERLLTDAAAQEEKAEFYVPMMDRFCKSALKLSGIIAALRMEEEVEIRVWDVRRAFYYLEPFIKNILDVVDNCGLTTSENTLRRARGLIRRAENMRFSHLLSTMHLTKRQGSELLETLEARGWAKIERNKNKDFNIVYVARPVAGKDK